MPTECNDTPVTNPRAHVTSNFPAGAIPTNDWWTSLLWRKFNCASISENLMAHPLAFHAYTNGLGVSYPTTASISGTATGVGEYHYNYAEDFRLGIAGLDADGKVDGYSDWTVSELWTNGSSSLRTTFGHGLPFVYATKTGGERDAGGHRGADRVEHRATVRSGTRSTATTTPRSARPAPPGPSPGTRSARR